MIHPRFAAIALAMAVSLSTTFAAAQALDATKYPDWKGQWIRIGGGGQFDPTKPPGRGQQPPLTDEYRAIWGGEPRGSGRRWAILQHPDPLPPGGHAA
jgi:hypothetical protein